MNPEFEQFIAKGEGESTEETTDTNRNAEGFSEAQLDLDIEVGAGELQNLRKLHAFKQKSRLERISLLYQTISNKLAKLIGRYATTVESTKREVIESEIHKLRVTQDIILNCLFWEQNNELEKEMVPQDVWEMIG